MLGQPHVVPDVNRSIPWEDSSSGDTIAFLSSLKKAQSPWFSLVMNCCLRAGSTTGIGRGYLLTFKGNLGPVLRMAETPRFLFFSRFCRSHRMGDVEKNLRRRGAALISAKAGVRKSGRSNLCGDACGMERVIVLNRPGRRRLPHRQPLSSADLLRSLPTHATPMLLSVSFVETGSRGPLVVRVGRRVVKTRRSKGRDQRHTPNCQPFAKTAVVIKMQ